MSWNYRVIEWPSDVPDEPYYQIHEVYYDESGAMTEYTENAIAAMGSGEKPLEELRWALDQMKLALDKPIIKTRDLPDNPDLLQQTEETK